MSTSEANTRTMSYRTGFSEETFCDSHGRKSVLLVTHFTFWIQHTISRLSYGPEFALSVTCLIVLHFSVSLATSHVCQVLLFFILVFYCIGKI